MGHSVLKRARMPTNFITFSKNRLINEAIEQLFH